MKQTEEDSESVFAFGGNLLGYFRLIVLTPIEDVNASYSKSLELHRPFYNFPWIKSDSCIKKCLNFGACVGLYFFLEIQGENIGFVEKSLENQC